MLTRESLILCGLTAYIGFAQHSDSDDIPLDETLSVTFGQAARAIYVPGTQMHPENVQHPPNISTPSWPTDSTRGLILMVDYDAPYKETRVSSLHWLVLGISLSSSSPSTDSPAPLNVPSQASVPWQPPNPPIGDIAHTYAFYLIAPIPSDLDIPGNLRSDGGRTPFKLKEWLEERGLERNVVARNHFRIRNLKGTPTAVFPGPRPSETDRLIRTRPEGNSGEGQVEIGNASGAGRIGVGMGFLAAILGMGIVWTVLV